MYGSEYQARDIWESSKQSNFLLQDPSSCKQQMVTSSEGVIMTAVVKKGRTAQRYTWTSQCTQGKAAKALQLTCLDDNT